ncbi:MAG: hypothetical protein KDC54_25230, partial [Lewinella sp.]|nr:hypothetical protein [Lewinella sp.]
MNIPRSIILFFASLCWLPVVLPGQPVWPGDVNNDNVVNEVDVLYLGWAYGAAGPARPDGDTDWEAQPAPSPWSQSFPDGQNYFFADVDGNGFVEEEDLDDGIESNFGLTHDLPTGSGYANAAPGTAPLIDLVPAMDIVGLGAQIDIDLLAGSLDEPLPSTYGLALKLSFGTTQGSMTTDLDYDVQPGNWLQNGGAPLLELHELDGLLSTGGLAMVRTDQQAVEQGAGKLGTFSVIIEDIVVGLQADTFWIKIDSVRLIGDNFQTIAAVPSATQVVVARNPDSLLLSSSVSLFSAGNLRVYPNP